MPDTTCGRAQCPEYGHCDEGFACASGIEPSPELCSICCVGDSCITGTDNGVTPHWEKPSAPCEKCHPCGNCNPDEIILPLDVFDADTKPCDICNPCARYETCDYCGNGFQRCDPVVKDEDGQIMHVDCAKKCYGEAV